MAPWLNQGNRADEVTPASDVFMLGKLLWCLVSGRIVLYEREFRELSFDLTVQFPSSIEMEYINLILDKCVVRHEHQCLPSAAELIVLVDQTIKKLESGPSRILLDGRLDRTCVMCGKGKYQPKVDYRNQILHCDISLNDPQNMPRSGAIAEVHVCDICSHHAFFAIGQPEGREKLGWPS